MSTYLDHLVIGAATLKQGRRYVLEQLGVDIPLGGCHVKMATHNCLIRLGDNSFLEVIAIDPNGKQPLRPRWFGLDDPRVRERIAEQPQLLTWVVNTENVEQILANSTISFGRAELFSRGELSWYFGLPGDGRLLAGGMLPYIIKWRTQEHPAGKMADTGCSLLSLKLQTPYPEWMRTQLKHIGALNLVDIISLPSDAPSLLLAVIDTPTGPKRLQSFI